MTIQVDRRRLIVGASGSMLLIGLPLHHSDAFWPEALAWWRSFSVQSAAGWLVETLKNFNLIPGSQASVPQKVQNDHLAEQSNHRSQGDGVKELYQGPYSGGDIAISSARRGDDAASYKGLITSNHSVHGGRSTCTIVHMAPDIYALNRISTTLRERGVPKSVIQGSALPVHSDSKYGNYDSSGHAEWREAMTPHGGRILWRANTSPNQETRVLADIDSPDLKTRGTVDFT